MRTNHGDEKVAVRGHEMVNSTDESLLTPRKDGSVRVAVRIRPKLPREVVRNAATCVKKAHEVENAIKLTTGMAFESTFTFDHVFSPSTTQMELYDQVLHPWMASFLQGFNVTVIAYGQTGSGKTYTMGNTMPSTSTMVNNLFARPCVQDDAIADTLESEEGLIPRFLYHLFTKVNETTDQCQLSVSFLEIYGEEIHDLLEKPETQKLKHRSESLQLREDKKNGVWVQGLTEVRVATRQEAMEEMRRGSLQRITASTHMNERSSRSHAVYTVKFVQRVSERKSKRSFIKEMDTTTRPIKSALESSVGGDIAESDAVIVSKLTFVDLAGSERLKKTLAEGERMKEGIQINVGLFALGNVINALGDDKRRNVSHVHVPYRSSKLTRLLQDALGGNSRTLFIACVSPADSNANETLNTLQYAKRAKNIQNKAVKNIDSRSAELANLKAFNQLLSRELIKAIIASLGDGCSGNMDTLTDACMANPNVLAYLSRMEQISSSTGLDVSSEERLIETQRLLNGLMTHLGELVPSNGYQRAASLTSLREHEAERIHPPDDLVDFISDSGSSVAMMEERKLDAEEGLAAPYPLEKLWRTVEIMNAAFEMHDIYQEGKRVREVLQVKISSLETRYHRQELVRNGMADMIDRMQTWLFSSVLDQVSLDKRRAVDCSVEAAKEKMELMETRMKDIERQLTALKTDLELVLERCYKEMKAKQQDIDEMRAIPGKATTNALNILTQKAELKVCFDKYDLDNIVEYLNEEEREMAAFVDRDDKAIASMSSLFTKEEVSSLQSRAIFSRIKDELQIAFDIEALEASIHKELRKRAHLFQKIKNGLLAHQRGEMSEREFMEKNEQHLKECEDSISQIRDAMRTREGQRASMAEILDSIKSLDIAKDVIRMLVVEMYSRWRISTMVDEEEKLRQQTSAEEMAKQTVAAMKADLNAEVASLEAKYEKDVQCAFQLVTRFNDAVKESSERLQVHDSSKETGATDAIEAFKEREAMLTAQLGEKEEEITILRAELDQCQASTKSMEMKEESFRLMSRCQEIWQELGFNEPEQASQFQDINDLLLKKCSEELEGLEVTRDKLQAQINDASHAVSRMEAVLHVDNPVDLQNLPAVAGRTLREQEKYLRMQQERLSSELWGRVNARLRFCKGIQELAMSLQIRSSEDFRHVSQAETRLFDADAVKLEAVKVDAWKAIEKKDSAWKLDHLLESLGDGDDISRFSVQQDEVLFNVLLKEKAERIVELEENLKTVRAVARASQLSHEDIVAVIHALRDEESSLGDEIDASRNVFDDLCARILQTGGQLDVSKRGLEVLAKVLRAFQEVQAGRSNARDFLHRIIEEATMLLHDERLGDSTEDEASTSPHHFAFPLPQVSHQDDRILDVLFAGKRILDALSEPVESSLRSLFYSMNDDFASFGIDTDEQRVSFFLGCKDEGQTTRRAILDKYALQSSAIPTASDEANLDSAAQERLPSCRNSFLSRLDPAFEELHWTYSMSFGDLQLQRLRASIADKQEVKSTVTSAQDRLRSLQKIMKIFNRINEFKTKIAEFEASASQKDRLFGNSLRLLEEERFRKMAAKHYPNLLAALQNEVLRWLKNEDSGYDLDVLGEELKTLLLDMMNTDTGLMHLDLGTVGRPSKHSLTSSSSSPALQATATSSHQAAVPAIGRARTESQNSRGHSPRAPSLKLDHE